jgi:glycosyltransferase involved in cell wall biosynthesis
MRILSVTAGAAGMYCGSCLRDNALATELMARGHDVTLLPLYTPTNPDEPNVSRNRVLFGGISVYLQQHLALFRKTPRLLDRLWDSPTVIGAFASRSISTDPKLLGDLTVSMLEGERGVLRKEFDKLLEWLAEEPVPDVINLPNSLLIGLAKPIGRALGRPVSCTLQGEELFLDGLIEPYRTQAIDLIRSQVGNVDRFIAVSDWYAPMMARLLAIPAEKMSVVPLGINLRGYERATADDDVFRVGYFARISPEKGLLGLAQAYVQLRRRSGDAPMRLEAAGFMSPAHKPYLEDVRRVLTDGGVGHELSYRGPLDRAQKIAFLRTLSVLSVPTPYDEPKGVFLLEAMASGVPVVQPRRGSFTEVVQKTGGGLLVAPDDPSALAEGLYELWRHPERRRELADRAFDGVRAHYSVQRSADAQMAVFEAMTREHGEDLSSERRRGAESRL